MKFTRSSNGDLFYFTRYGKVTLGPYLAETATGSKWADDPKDDFPTDQRWSDAFEAMLRWLSNRFPVQYQNAFSVGCGEKADPATRRLPR